MVLLIIIPTRLLHAYLQEFGKSSISLGLYIIWSKSANFTLKSFVKCG